jgi:hypothetical protein
MTYQAIEDIWILLRISNVQGRLFVDVFDLGLCSGIDELANNLRIVLEDRCVKAGSASVVGLVLHRQPVVDQVGGDLCLASDGRALKFS